MDKNEQDLIDLRGDDILEKLPAKPKKDPGEIKAPVTQRVEYIVFTNIWGTFPLDQLN